MKNEKYNCICCGNHRQIEIVSEITGDTLDFKECPICSGRGFIDFYYDLWGPNFDIWFKRMNERPKKAPPKDYPTKEELDDGEGWKYGIG